MLSRPRSAGAGAASLLAVVLVACAATPADDDPSDGEGSAGALTAGSSSSKVSLLYEGTCDFLHQCSSFSKKLPGTGVEWGCGGTPDCRDSELWVAGPTHAHCNKHVRLCNGSTCTDALVKDVSVSAHWEASNGVLDRLGLPHALTGRCQGSGGGSVVATFPAPPTPTVDAAADADADAGDPSD